MAASASFQNFLRTIFINSTAMYASIWHEISNTPSLNKYLDILILEKAQAFLDLVLFL